MGVHTYNAPDYSSQSGTVYPTNIDKALAVHHRLAGWFAPHEQSAGSPAPDLTVVVDAGFIRDGNSLSEKAQQTVTGFTIPSSGTRIDRIVIDARNGDARRVEGTAVAGSPSAVAPDIPAGTIPCCQVAISSTDTAIANSMITDERAPWMVSCLSTLDAAATTSGSAFDFAVPPGAKRITISFSRVSLNGSDDLVVQIGPSSGIENTGYVSASAATPNAGATVTSSSTLGFIIRAAGAAAGFTGHMVLSLHDTSVWVSSHSGIVTTTSAVYGGGVKTITGDIGIVKITRTGSDTFDFGSVNVHFE